LSGGYNDIFDIDLLHSTSEYGAVLGIGKPDTIAFHARAYLTIRQLSTGILDRLCYLMQLLTGKVGVVYKIDNLVKIHY
jgi:hypothetical protein